jgi:hypothetical protein
VQIVAALVNWDEFWLMLEGMLTWALLFVNAGSGKSGKPCRRMQAASVRERGTPSAPLPLIN